MIKRAFDVLVAVAGLVLLSPLYAIAALLVKLGSAGPHLFRQERIGRHFRPFTIYKFRTMRPAPALDHTMAMGDETRVTRFGRFLRRTKLDEVPQLLNVLKGDMSLVGPRPELRQYVDVYRADYEEILQVRPGITDPASIKYRNEEARLAAAADPEAEYVRRILPDKIRLSREYVRRRSFLFDLLVLAQTVYYAGREDDTALAPSATGASPQEPSQGPVVDTLLRFPRELRRALVVAVHLILAIVSEYLAFSLRFDGQIPDAYLQMFVGTLPWLLLARGSTLFLFRLEEGLWRYAGLWDLRRIVGAVGTGTILFAICARVGYGTSDYPRSIFLIDSALLLILMGAFRLSPRIYRELGRPRGERRLLIFGAGDTGERILRQLQHDPASIYEPVGFVDDDEGKVGQRIHGVPVVGALRDLPQLVERHRPHEVMVAIPKARPGLIREMVTVLEPFNVPLTKIVERNRSGKGAQIRNLSIEDLLSRPPVGLDVNQVRDLVTGKRVLVTGAGGSIGSELCRQIAALHPESLVLFERYENGLYAVATGLHDGNNGAFVHSAIGDVTDAARLNAVFHQHRPEIVFHAAAHKHVPLMEANPCEAVKNNITGTRLVAETAKRHGVERFILISTDKAANPTSVMGATKRVAELLIRLVAFRGSTRFVTVRFGNVLGSNGSVLPRFQEQIKAGGPVTVTHPDITRYFMLIPEAVQLVLHAAAVGEGGDTLVLDMGEQIRVLDLARNLIRLSGHTPDDDIPIVFTGMRPGEKLFEELAGEGELVEGGPVDKIQRVISQAPHLGAIEDDLRALEQAAAHGDGDAAIALLCRLVPTYQRARTLVTA